MQPDRNDTWQQPDEQPSRAPYTATPDEVPVSPVVTMSPDVESLQSTPQFDEEDIPESTQTTGEQPVQWQATEYIHHDKNGVWFVIFALVTLGLMAFAIFAIQSLTFAVLIPVMAVALLTYTQRPPRLINYTLSRKGLHLNDHLYSFAEFKAFGVIRDGAEYSIMLVPTKRFRPGVSVYFPEAVGEQLVDILAARLPMRDLHLDVVDRLIRKLRI